MRYRQDEVVGFEGGGGRRRSRMPHTGVEARTDVHRVEGGGPGLYWVRCQWMVVGWLGTQRVCKGRSPNVLFGLDRALGCCYSCTGLVRVELRLRTSPTGDSDSD